MDEPDTETTLPQITLDVHTANFFTQHMDTRGEIAATDPPRKWEVAFSIYLCYVVRQLTLAEVLVTVRGWSPAPPQPEDVLREGGPWWSYEYVW